MEKEQMRALNVKKKKKKNPKKILNQIKKKKKKKKKKRALKKKKKKKRIPSTILDQIETINNSIAHNRESISDLNFG